MSKEWSSPYNPFNSMKALVHADRFAAILDGKPKSPIIVNFDLTNLCNYNCRFCMFGGRKRADPSGEEFLQQNAHLEKGYALTLPKIWAKWGVRAICLAGGGEPSLHPDCQEFIKESKRYELQLGFITNGYLVNNEEWWKTVAKNCKFVGFSIDAGTKKDYEKVKGVSGEQFNTIIDNLKGIAAAKKKYKTNLQIGYKFLLDQYNQNSIYKAIVLASKIGINHFQFRPAIDDYKYSEDELKNIWNQIEKGQKLERDDFKVIGVQHKFNNDLSKKHCFSKCRANMLTTTWCADGWLYLCTDTRGCKWSRLVKHYPDPMKAIKFWGSKKHFDIVNKIDFHKDCDRCTLTAYNEMFENVFMEDKMDRFLI